MIDLVLINPSASPEERYGALGEAGSRLPPLGLALLAAIARERGHSVVILDAEAEGLAPSDAASRLAELQPRVAGFTAVTMSVHAAAECARSLKQASPGTFLILGGTHATSCAEQTYRAFPWFDAIAVGEADQTLPDLLDCVVRGDGSLEDVAGLMLRTADGSFVRTPGRDLTDGLDGLPAPAFDLLPGFPYAYRPAPHSYRRLPATSLVSSRGCPGRCTFCDRTVSGSRVRAYSAEYLVGLIEDLRDEYGVREVVFHDDNFVAMRRRLDEFCALMIDRRVGVDWACTARVDMVGAEQLATMRQAGCWQISYGIESGSQAILDSICKGTTLEGVARTVAATRAAGIESHGYFMIGLPGESPETLAETLAFLLELPLDDFHMTIWSPHPGTELTRSLEESGWALSAADWPRLNDWTPVYVPEGLSANELLAAQREAFRRFYLRPRVFASYGRKMLRHPSITPGLFAAFATWARAVARP